MMTKSLEYELVRQKLAVLAGISAPRIYNWTVGMKDFGPEVVRIPYWRMVSVLSGTRRCRYGDGKGMRERVFGPGEAFVVEPGVACWEDFDDEYNQVSVVCRGSRLRMISVTHRAGAPHARLPDAILLAGGHEDSALIESLLRAMAHLAGAGRSARATELFAVTMGEVQRILDRDRDDVLSPTHHLVERIIHNIEAHLSEDIGCASLARDYQCHPSYIAKLFRRRLGCGFGEYLTRRRMELARQLLKESSRNVNEIAAACGYRRTNYFIKVFRARHESTPHAWRNANT